MSCFWSHDWTKWSDPEEVHMQHISFKGDRTPINYVVRVQKRKCTRCDLVEEQEV